MKTLITGASGFLGGALVDEFNRHGTVYPVGFQDPRYPKVDLRVESEVASLISDAQPDCIIHAAAYRDPDFCEQHQEEADRLNIDATRFLLQHSSAKTVFVYISTDYVFGGDQAPYTEGDKVAPINYYGVTKAASESWVRKLHPAHLIIRIPVLIGREPKKKYTGFMERVLSPLLGSEKVTVDHKIVRRPTAITEVARGIAHLISAKKQGTYHISASYGGTQYELLKKAAQVLGVKDNHLMPSIEALPRPGKRPTNTSLNTQKIEGTGYRCQETFLDYL